MTLKKQWQLHPTLAKDCHVLGRTASVELLLHSNAALHWFILVPHTSVVDLFDLDLNERDALFAEAQRLSDHLKQRLNYPRVNVGALGLVVPQLHLHVVGRREDDPCWPAPVWGNLKTGDTYSSEQIEHVRGELDALGCFKA
ncbi:HIT domain-containing protein [Congregibacter sp.]|uniref:HIT domain-containing protein n=1 Tax=Congregibacter sp. TaxID=2744308 RepID=UPI00385DF7EB